jgi:hypothetical protein
MTASRCGCRRFHPTRARCEYAVEAVARAAAYGNSTLGARTDSSDPSAQWMTAPSDACLDDGDTRWDRLEHGVARAHWVT